MFKITLEGRTPAELSERAKLLAEFLGGTSTVAINTALSQQDQAQLRTDATVVPPKNDAAAKKAAKEAAKKAAEDAAKASETADESSESNEGSADDDALGESDEAFTKEDVKAILLEMKAAYPSDTTIVSEIIKTHGGVKTLSDVPADKYAAIVTAARAKLAKAKKK